jgi:O-antigen ligase
MFKNGIIRLDLDEIIKVLFCFYAFSIPFELLFEVLFGIETIFKPFRIIGLIILGVFGVKTLKNGLEVLPQEKNDALFYGLIVYGILISCVKIITGPFNLSYFYNDLFLVGLNVLIYFVFKNTRLSHQEVLRIVYFFVAGILGNCLYIFYTFFFRGMAMRQSGFSDNPNYTALAIGAVITFLLLRSNFVKGIWKQLFILFLISFFSYIFLITGSRTGLIILVFAVLIVFAFSSIYRKVLVLSVAVGIGLFLAPQQLSNANIGGPLILVNRINKKLDKDEVDVRFVIWKGVFRMLESEGYEGMGIGQYKDKFDQYFSTEGHLYILNIVERGYFLSTHNDYLAIVTDYGLPGLLLYLFFLLFSFVKLLRRVTYPSEDDDAKFLIQYKFILICCLIIFGMASENLPNPLFWFLMMVATKE